MSARLLLIVVCALLVGLVWQGDGLAQDKKGSGGKVTSSSKKVTSSVKKSAAPAVKKKVSSGGGGKAKSAPVVKKKKVPSGGGGKATSAPVVEKKGKSTTGGTTTTKKQLPDLGNKPKTKAAEKEGDAPAPKEEEAASPGELDAPVEGGTSTTQAITPDELDEFIEENPDSVVQDADGDGDYEIVYALETDASVLVENGYAYVDVDGDGSIDAVIPADYYDPETNEIQLPVDPDDLNIIGDDRLDSDHEEVGYILEDRDGDGVPEAYRAYDYNNDGVADIIEYWEGGVSPGNDVELGYVEASNLPFNTRDEEEEPDTAEEAPDPDVDKRPRGTARLNLFGGGGGVPAQPAALPADDVTQALTDLKSLYDKGLLPDSQYEIMQGQALAALDPQATGIEGGLQLLRGFWDQGLISADPYAAKRKEYLDAL